MMTPLRAIRVAVVAGLWMFRGPAAMGGSISGKVSNSQGSPLTGVWLDAYTTGGSFTNSGITSADGVYAITNLTAGQYLVRTYALYDNVVDEWYDNVIAQEGAIPDAATPVTVGAGIASNIDFTLADAGTITGRVTRTGGAALLNVWVEAYDEGESIQGSAVSGGDGYYVLSKFPAGYYRLRTQVYSLPYADEWYSNVQAVGFSIPAAAQEVYVATNDFTGPIDFALSTGAVIGGKVTSASSQPLTNVWVDVYTADGDWVQSGASGTGGLYRIQGLPAGTFYARSYAGAANYADEWYREVQVLGYAIPTNALPLVLTEGLVASNINFTLAQGARISGAVSNAAGTPLGGVRVDVDLADATWVKSAYTDGSGRYSASGLPAGTFYARTYAGGTNLVDEWFRNVNAVGGDVPAAASGITVNAGMTVSNVNFGLDPGGVITGRVHAVGGAALGGVAVYVYDGNTVWIKEGTTRADGGYRVEGLAAGNFYVRTAASGLNYADEWFDDAPVLGAGIPAAAAPVAVTQAVVTGSIDFTLAQGGGIAGRVTTGTNAPLSGARLDLYSSSAVFVAERWTDYDGRYAFDSLPAEDFHVRTAASANYVDEWYDNVPLAGFGIPAAAAALHVTAGGVVSNADFVLATGGAIAGTVTGTSGVPVQGVWVDVYDAQSNWVKSASSGSGGSYQVQGLSTQSAWYARTADGFHNFVDEWYRNVPVAGSGIPPGAQAIAVTAGVDTAGIDFALEAGGWIEGLISDAIGSPLVGIGVDLYQTNGTWIGRALTDSAGWYEFDQVAEAGYYLRTESGSQGFVDEWHNDIPVAGGQIPAGVAAVQVHGGSATNVGLALGYRVMEVSWSSGRFYVFWQAASGTTYRVRDSADLLTGAWTNAPDGSNVLEQSLQMSTAQQVLLYRDPRPAQTQRLYRVGIEF